MKAASIMSEARHRAGLTLRGLAKRAETSHSALAAYESASKRPTTETFFRVVESAGFAVDVELAPRKRGTEDSLERGDELQQVLELAEQFPARHDLELQCPPFKMTR